MISPNFGAHWKVIGVCLGMPNGEMKIIEANHPNDAKGCCNKMLGKWLELDPNASWEKMFAAIESPAIATQAGMIDTIIICSYIGYLHD